jgi:hypothetical protein
MPLTNQQINMPIEKFKTLTSTCVPMPIENVDTDQIIPARFLKATTRDGLAPIFFVIGGISLVVSLIRTLSLITHSIKENC